MRLAAVLDRCLAVEQRAGAFYRRFADASIDHDDLRAAWLRLAAEEDEHAAAIAIARATVDPAVAAESRVDGWGQALARAEEILGRAEAAAPPSVDDQLALALDLEGTEIDLLRQLVLQTVGQACDAEAATSHHALELADLAARHSQDARVRLREALVRAHRRLDAGSL
jgi:rubrerythrin